MTLRALIANTGALRGVVALTWGSQSGTQREGHSNGKRCKAPRTLGTTFALTRLMRRLGFLVPLLWANLLFACGASGGSTGSGGSSSGGGSTGSSGSPDGGADADGSSADGSALPSDLGKSCDNGPCSPPLTPVTYCGFAGCSAGTFCACEIPCPKDPKMCPAGTICTSVGDGPSNVCLP
jgi:hypothetical protein